MTIIEFIHQYRKEIDEAIPGGVDIDDHERELWVLNDESLYKWAQAEGVEI